MSTRKVTAVALAVGLLATGLAACAGGATFAPANDGLSGYSEKQAYPQASAAATAAAFIPDGGSAAGTTGPAATSRPADNITQPEDAIIKTGSVRVQVADLDKAIAAAADQMHGLGGYLAGSERSRSDTYALASVTYRVPASRFEDALATARKLGTKVVSEHTETTPVGSRIVDLRARIDNLKASEKAVQAIMGKAKTIQDTLTVEQRLSDIQGEIEQLTAQLTGLTDQATYSTLTLEFEVADPSATPTPSPTATPAVGWSASHEFDSAAGVLTSIAQAVATAGIWLAVVVLPVAIVVLLFVLVLAVAWRLSGPTRRRFARPSPSPAAAAASGQTPNLPISGSGA